MLRELSPLLRALSYLVGPLLVLLSTSRACADEAPAADARPSEQAPAPLDKRTVGPWDHFEVSMGFLAGQRRYLDTPFGFSGGDGGATPGANSLVEPLQRAPFDRVNVYGLRYDARLVVSYVRMTMGFDLPFSAFNVGNTSGQYSLQGTTRTVTARSLTTRGLRFGLGVEAPIGPVAPYVDLLGAVHWTTAGLAVDGAPVEYDATAFAMSLRGGLRLHLRKWFFATAAGEIGLAGDVRWGTELSVGFAFM